MYPGGQFSSGGLVSAKRSCAQRNYLVYSVSSGKLLLILLAFRKATFSFPHYSFSNHIHILILAYEKDRPCWWSGLWGSRGSWNQEKRSAEMLRTAFKK